jgi:LPXTG-motif cell wall-anchored protein
VTPGEYTVRPVVPAGFTLTVPNTGGDDTIDSDVIPATGETAIITVTGGAGIGDVDAGVYEPATIGDTVFVDLDQDGVQDAGEPGLAGVVVTVYDVDGNLVGTTTTGVDGTYSIDVVPGTQTVTIGLPTGYASGAAGDTQTVVVTSGSTDNTVDFPAVGTADLAGAIIYDVSNDGSLDADDPGLGGVTVTATWAGPDGPVVFTTTTAPDGSYVFADLPPGDFTVVVDPSTLPNGIVDPTLDPDGVLDLETMVSVSGVSVPDVDFGFSGTASLGDNVFLDANGNGVLDAGETGIAGATIIATVLTTGGVMTYTTVSDANGNYLFTDLPAGDYTITVDPTTVPGVYSLTLPEIEVVLSLDGVDLTADFPVELIDGPEAFDDADSTPPSTPVVIPVSANDSIVPGTTVTVTVTSPPSNGTVEVNPDGTVTFTPDDDFTGGDSFEYTICDMDGLNAAGNTPANHGVFCSTATVTVTVTGLPPLTPPITPPLPPERPNPPTPSATTPGLPTTGSDLGNIQTLGAVLLLVGLGLWLASRRRRNDGGKGDTRPGGASIARSNT